MRSGSLRKLLEVSEPNLGLRILTVNKPEPISEVIFPTAAETPKIRGDPAFLIFCLQTASEGGYRSQLIFHR